MAGDSLLAYLQENSVCIAIDGDRFNGLQVTALFALFPESIATATPVNRLAAAQRFLVGFFIHVSQHQHLIGFYVLRNCRQQTVGA